MKKIKVYKDGKLWRRIDGRFDSFRSKLRRFVRRMVKLVFSGLVIGTVLIGVVSYAYNTGLNKSEVIFTETKSNLPEKIEGLKDDVVARLAECETPGYEESDAPMILDSNSAMSIGRWMYQIKTVQYYWKMFYKEDITRKEAVLIALDEKKASELTKKIIFEDEGKGIGNWHNCNIKHGFKAEINLIKKLEK